MSMLNNDYAHFSPPKNDRAPSAHGQVAGITSYAAEKMSTLIYDYAQ
jgi:hypothetical protein